MGVTLCELQVFFECKVSVMCFLLERRGKLTDFNEILLVGKRGLRKRERERE